MATGKPEGFLHSFVFAIWDNVIGPKILKTWSPETLQLKFKKINDCLSTEDSEEIDEIGLEINEENQSIIRNGASLGNASGIFSKPEDDAIAKYIAVHTLTGHLVKTQKTDYEMLSDICLSVPALQFVAQTATFYCLITDNSNHPEGYIEDPCMCSLSIVFHVDHENNFWKLHPLLLHFLHQTTQKIKVGLSQDSYYHEKPIVSQWMAEVYSQIKSTMKRSVKFPTQSPLTVKQIFHKSLLPWDVIISAMISTGSCCIVGRNEEIINRVIDLLLYFLPDPSQTLCSRYASHHFCSGLHIQGLLEDSHGGRNINSADILLNEFPLTLVDLSQKGRVKFSGYIHEHYRRKQRQLRQLEYNIVEHLEPDTPFTTESVFRSFGSSSRYVRWCLEQLETHNVEHWPRIISSFHRALSCQANSLINAFQAERLQKNETSTSICSRLKKSLQITEPDFWLLAAIAERMEPGFCQSFTSYRIL